MPTRKAIRFNVNSSGTEMEQVVHTHQASCQSGWPSGFGALNPSPHSLIFTSTLADSRPRSYSFTVSLVHHKQWNQNLFRCATIHFQDRRGAASPFLCVNQRAIRCGFRTGV